MALRKNLNYKTRIFLLILTFTWIVAFVIFGIFYYREKEFKAEMLDSQLQIYNAQLLHSLDGGLDAGIGYIRSLERPDSIRFTILTLSGEVVYDTQGIAAGTDHSTRQEITKAQTSGRGYTLNRVSTSDNRNYFYSARMGKDYIVRSSLPYDESLVKSLSNETIYLWTILIISVALSIIAFFASFRLGTNIDKLRDFAIRAELGEVPEAADVEFADDELGEISTHIIHLYNQAHNASIERDRYYENLLQEEKEKTRIKNQLTNNINHELKTPVHAVQGCLETILGHWDDMDASQIRELIVKSHDQIKRLCALLVDLSTITRLTEAPHLIRKETTDIAPIIAGIKENVELLPREKRMRVNLEIKSSMPISGDRQLLESIFQNLVDNSLAYSGGRDIYIRLLDEDGDRYRFSVSDNGIGIEEQHLERIFERFYRIDEGRSRKAGGTGLGLSIVKNSVAFHGGSIKALPRQGGGVEFVFTLGKS